MSAATDQRERIGRTPWRPVRLGETRHRLTHGGDGSVVIEACEPLGAYPARLTDHLVRWAAEVPDRTFLAERDGSGAWRHLSYGEALAQAARIGAGLLERGLSAERPLVILSGKGLDHAVLALAALHVGVPYAPVSPTYARLAPDFARLKDVVGLLTPGLVYARDGSFAAALAAAVPVATEVATLDGALPGRRATALRELVGDAAVAARAHGEVTGDTIAKFLFTSGSTGLPKAVINTHAMLCANQAQLAASLVFLADTPPILVDWLPWHHTFGGNHNFNLVLANGGSLYLDDGQPTPAGIAETVRNLKEIAPTVYFSVPKGYEALIPHLAKDGELRRRFLRRLELTFFAAAGLPQPVWDAFDRLAIDECGHRIPMLTGLGATETAPFALTCDLGQAQAGNVGLPARGLTLKLTPVGEKLEARVKGPNITPGYWRNPGLTAAAFDAEGYYRLGDALRFVEPAEPRRGLRFDGRLHEDFKLTSGVWVSVGALRAAFLDAAAPYARDIALAGENLDEVTGLIVPDLDACRQLCPDLAETCEPQAVLDDVRVRDAFSRILGRMAARATGSSTRLARALLLAEPPSIDRNEMTDKGSINQRALLRNRAELVALLYRTPYAERIIITPEGSASSCLASATRDGS